MKPESNVLLRKATYGCCPYLELRDPPASSSILRPGSIPAYILLYCICCAVNIAWLSIMHLKYKQEYYFGQFHISVVARLPSKVSKQNLDIKIAQFVRQADR